MFHTSFAIVKQSVFFFFLSSVYTTMKSALGSITSERERLKQLVDCETCPPPSPQVVGLKNALATVGENALAQTCPYEKPANIRRNGLSPLSDGVFLPRDFAGVTRRRASRRDVLAADVIPPT